MFVKTIFATRLRKSIEVAVKIWEFVLLILSTLATKRFRSTFQIANYRFGPDFFLDIDRDRIDKQIFGVVMDPCAPEELRVKISVALVAYRLWCLLIDRDETFEFGSGNVLPPGIGVLEALDIN